MGLHARQIPQECVFKGNASRLVAMAKLAPPRNMISVESVEVTTRAARRCRDFSQSLRE